MEAGYRLIDMAAAYINEKAIGRAVNSSGIPRKEIFLTTKLWIQDAGYGAALKAVDASLKSFKQIVWTFTSFTSPSAITTDCKEAFARQPQATVLLNTRSTNEIQEGLQ